jgi:type IV secretory pathway TrbD component
VSNETNPAQTVATHATNEKKSPAAPQTNEEKSADRTARIVFAGLTANAATAFVIQAWMTYGFGSEVWKLPVALCVALIFALDVFAVTFMVLTYLLRGTGWPRVFVTIVFLGAIGAQVWAAELFGDHMNWSPEIRWFAALPAVLLALSQEGVIMWRTHRADRRAPSPRAERKGPRPNNPAPEKPQTGAAPMRMRPARPSTPPPPPPAPSGKGGRGRPVDPAELQRRDDLVEEVHRLGADKPAKEKIAEKAGVTTRTIENWMASYKERHPETPGNPTPETGNPQVTTEVNPNV